MHSVIGGFTMAAPMSLDTIKFNRNIFNNLRLLLNSLILYRRIDFQFSSMIETLNFRRSGCHLMMPKC